MSAPTIRYAMKVEIPLDFDPECSATAPEVAVDRLVELDMLLSGVEPASIEVLTDFHDKGFWLCIDIGEDEMSDSYRAVIEAGVREIGLYAREEVIADTIVDGQASSFCVEPGPYPPADSFYDIREADIMAASF